MNNLMQNTYVIGEITEDDLPTGFDWRSYTVHAMPHGYIIPLAWIYTEIKAGIAELPKKKLYKKYSKTHDILYIKTRLELV